LQVWLDDPLMSKYLDINEHEDVLWFNQEGIQEFFWWLMVLAVLEELEKDPKGHAITAKKLQAIHQVIEKMVAAEKGSGFQVKKLMERLKE
jgi:hypothetical protein